MEVKWISKIVAKTSKWFYDNLLIILTIYGAWAMIDSFRDKYDLSISTDRVRESKDFTFTTLTIQNDGDAIGKEDIYSPIQLKYDTRILRVIAVQKSSELIEVNTIVKDRILDIDFNLLNEDEKITLWILSKVPVGKPKINSRIRNISKISYYHLDSYPRFWRRINYWWAIFALFGLLTCIDAFILILKDIELQGVLNHIKNLTTNADKSSFLDRYKELYRLYKPNIRFIPANDLFKMIEESLNESSLDSDDHLEQAKKRLSDLTFASVLYRARTPYMIFGPIFFIIGLTMVIVILFWYELTK